MELGLTAEARRAGDYLIDHVWNSDLRVYPFELAGPQFTYFFDTGIIARGLLRLFEHVGDMRYLNAGVQAAESMVVHFAASAGFHPILRLPELEPVEYTEWWSRRPGCFQLKAALAWREIGAGFEDSYRRQLAFSLQTLDQLLPLDEKPEKLMDRLHPYCYFLEGLLPEIALYGDRIEKGIGTVGRHLRAIAPAFLRSDVCAQLLRVRLLAAQGGIPLDEGAAGEEARLLESFQISDEQDARLYGAFAFGKREGQLIPHANPVSTIFGVQALDWWHKFREGTFTSTWRDLI